MRRPITEDTFFNGQVRVRQHADGYRFSIDPVILAWHLLPPANARIVDLGTGCGIIPLILAHRFPSIHVTGVEIQPALADLAQANVLENDMADRITIACRDITDISPAEFTPRPDMVVCNPPFHKADSGRINPDSERAIARHEIRMTLTDLATTAGRLLDTAGEFCLIYPAERLADLVCAMREAALEPKFLRFIHSRKKTEAKLVLVKAAKNGRPGAFIAAPLIIYQADDDYTPEAEEMFQP